MSIVHLITFIPYLVCNNIEINFWATIYKGICDYLSFRFSCESSSSVHLWSACFHFPTPGATSSSSTRSSWSRLGASCRSSTASSMDLISQSRAAPNASLNSAGDTWPLKASCRTTSTSSPEPSSASGSRNWRRTTRKRRQRHGAYSLPSSSTTWRLDTRRSSSCDYRTRTELQSRVQSDCRGSVLLVIMLWMWCTSVEF